MTRRVRRVASKALKTEKIDLPWSGTFHAVGARLLREYAHLIGLKPSFTILDRSDAADLMNLVRHDLGQSEKETADFQEGHLFELSTRLRSIPGSRSKRILSTSFPWCADWEGELRTLFAEYTRPSKGRMSSISMICCFTGRKC